MRKIFGHFIYGFLIFRQRIVLDLQQSAEFAVGDIEAALQHLKNEGARLIDTEPRIGGRGARIAFVHPKEFAGTLVELVEVAAGGNDD